MKLEMVRIPSLVLVVLPLHIGHSLEEKVQDCSGHETIVLIVVTIHVGDEGLKDITQTGEKDGGHLCEAVPSVGKSFMALRNSGSCPIPVLAAKS